MRIEKISENTIRVTLAASDFENRGMEASMEEMHSPACHDLLMDILDHAEIEMGMEGLGNQVIVQTASDSHGNYIFTVTGTGTALDSEPRDGMDELIDALLEVKENKYEDYMVFHFEDFESLLGAAQHCPTPRGIPSRLYTYKNSYYLMMTVSGRNFCAGLRFEEVCCEFNGVKKDSGLTVPLLLEHGKILFRRNAIQSLMNKFS